MSEAYDAFAERVVAEGTILDPWQDGEPRLEATPLVVSSEKYAALAKVAQEVAEVYDELSRLVDDDEDAADAFFALRPAHRLMWDASRPGWHGFARADVFETANGYVISELNCDTPTGEPEAVVLSALAHADQPDLVNPNATLELRFGDMLELMIDRLVDGDAPRTVGIVYPTEFTEDLSVVRLYRRWLTARGFEVVLGSPYNLGTADDGRTTLFDVPLGAMLRHYKTDAWGEREGSFVDDDPPDRVPLFEPLAAAVRGSVERRTAVINPFASIVPQNKLSMAFMWERIHRFSRRSQSIIERHVPYTSRVETVHKERLFADREGWVLKSAWGAEGSEVILGRATNDDEWRSLVAKARPRRFVAQRYFDAVGTNGGPPENYGVFLVGGAASGLYVRRQTGVTDELAISVPVLVRGA